MHLYFYFTYNSSALVGSAFGAIWEDPEGGFMKFMVKRALKQDQTLHMEGKLHVILYFREECVVFIHKTFLPNAYFARNKTELIWYSCSNSWEDCLCLLSVWAGRNGNCTFPTALKKALIVLQKKWMVLVGNNDKTKVFCIILLLGIW